MSEPVGYFVWRTTLKGGVSCEKIAVEHFVQSKRADTEHHIVQEHRLDSKGWALSLNALEAVFPFEGRDNAA